MLRTRFRLNTETFQYEPVTFNWLTFKQQLRLSAILGFSLGALSLLLCFAFVGSPKAIYLERQKSSYVRLVKDQISDAKKLEKDINKIHRNDNNFYRSILNAEAIDVGIWEAGTGGSTQDIPKDPVLKESVSLLAKLKNKFSIQKNSFSSIMNVAVKKQEELMHTPAMRPLNTRVMSGFGYRMDPIHGGGHFHTGLDFDASMYTPIKATGGGTIITAGETASGWGYGIQVEIDHGYGYITKYAHLSKVKVRIGQKVNRGDVIGLSGNTGWSTGPHLHYEIIRNGVKVNPYDFFYTN